jgi:site-specific DNA-methyltransferase (adenine-specific)
MVDILKPGGALLVLNIPKWAVYHAVFLLNKMNFQHWIVWDALSTPAGKLLPAHYALLYFTKPGDRIKNNYEKLKYIDSRKYCLRLSCIRDRKLRGEDEKEKMSDIWKDIHRIKHKRDRDYHPCQLPIKLMNRIIELFTNEGDLVYDPFGGAGTTGISSILLKRRFILSEIDPKYVEISERNLKKIIVDEEGKLGYIRESVKQKNNGNGVAKKSVEVGYLQLCSKYDRILDKDEIEFLDFKLYDLLGKYTGNFKKLQNVCKRKFESEILIN